MRMTTLDIRTEPRYPLIEASHLTAVPKATLRTWFVGWHAANRAPQPAILRPDQAAVEPLTLSFYNVIEARFLAAYRRLGVPMQRVRVALEYVQTRMPTERRPLLTRTFETDGRGLFIEFIHSDGDPRLLEVSAGGQQVWPEIVRAHFKSIEFDDTGHPARFWLDPRHKLVVDPRVAWGMPAIAKTGLRTEIVFERFDAGEDVDVIAEDFSLDPHTVQEALRWEQQARLAA
ncbi:MAG: DUF433 domain-containing protein [Myxococcota bacterium]